MSLTPPEALFIDEAERALAVPGAAERWSLLTGEPWILVDLRRNAGGPRFSEARARALGERLLVLPAVTAALVDETSAQGPVAVLAAAFDLHRKAPRELAAVGENLAERPLACLALVQLLRLGEGRPLQDALVAESLVYSTLQAGPEFAAWLAKRGPVRAKPAADGPAVVVTREGDCLRLELNRPAKRNAFSAEMRDALCQALEVAQADPGLRVELRGRGPAFCSGGDLDEFGSLPDPATAHAIRSTRNAGRMLAGLAARASVFVHGACVGAGIEVPAFAGRVVALEDAFFQLPELSLGLVPGAGGTASLPRRIGRQRTAWLALSGERIDSTTALDWGLVDELAIR